MGKELYIHIGQYKTGTSALQSFFARNRELLRKQGLYYPLLDGEYMFREKNAGTSGNAVDLTKLACPFAELKDIQLDYMQRIADSLKDNDRVLLSSEAIWMSEPVVFENIKMFLQRKIDVNIKIKIIVYLRRQDESMESFWNQQVKSSFYKYSCQKFVEEHMGKYFDYDSYLEKISKVVGKDNMIVKIYDQKQLMYGQNIFVQFLSIFGLKDLSKFIIPKYQANPPMGEALVEFKRILNAVPGSQILDDEFRTNFKEQTVFPENTQEVVHSPSFLSYDERKRILDRYEKGNQMIGKTYFEIDDSPFPKLEDKYDKKLSGGGINEEIVFFLGKILVHQAEEIEKLHWETDHLVLPEGLISGSRVIIYGADKKGRRLYHYIQRIKRYQVVGFVDKRWEIYSKIESSVEDPMMIFTTDFDYILIGVGPQDTAQRICEWLAIRGISMDKIMRLEL